MIQDELLTIVARTTSSSVIITDADRKILWVNDSFTKLTGYSKEEVIGQKPSSMLQGIESKRHIVQQMRQALNDQVNFTGEFINYAKDGSPYWIRLIIDPVFDEQGCLTNYIGVQQDISDERQIKEDLHEANERLKLATGGSGIGVWDYDPNENILKWDEFMHELYGTNRTIYWSSQ